MGAVLLRKPAKLARLVAGIAEKSALPLSVKIRTGAKGVTETNTVEVRLYSSMWYHHILNPFHSESSGNMLCVQPQLHQHEASISEF